MEKTLKPHLVSWVTYNSRISERMKQYKVKKGKALYLDEKSEIKITELIHEIIKDNNLKCLAYAICGDHVRIVLVCSEDELPGMVQKIKSISARKYNIWTGATLPKRNEQGSMLPCPEGTKEVNTVTRKKALRGTTQNHLWAQKYNVSFIDTEKKLLTTINYVMTTRLKHGLPAFSKGASSLVQDIVCDIDTAFKP